MTTPPDRTRQPAETAGAFLIESCDIPDGMTLREWRAAIAAERRAETRARGRRLRIALALAPRAFRRR